MRIRSPGRRAAAASLLLPWLFSAGLLLMASSARAGDPGCPSAGDVVYVVKDGDTLSDITSRFYSPDNDAQLHAVWEALYAYNKKVIGPDADRFRYGSGTMLCLRDRLSGPGWTLIRKGGGASAPPGVTEPASGRERKGDSKEDAEHAPAGQKDAQHVDVYHHFDKPPAAEGPSSMGKASDSPPPRPNPLRRVVLDGMLGVMVPLSPALHDSLFREVGIAVLGLRLTLGPVEIVARGVFVGGRGATVRHQLEHPQTIVGGGASLQIGLPIDWHLGGRGVLRLLPGLESGLLYVRRNIDAVNTYYREEATSLAVMLPLAGALMRVEYALPRSLRWRVAVEAAGDLLFERASGADLSQSFAFNVLGGLGHAF